MIVAPCKDCSDRVVGCHSNCSKYNEYRSLLDDRKKKEREDKDFIEYVMNTPAHRWIIKHRRITKSSNRVVETITTIRKR